MATSGLGYVHGNYMFNASTVDEVGYYIKTHVKELWTPFFEIMKDAVKESLCEVNDSELESDDSDPVGDGWDGGTVFTLFKKIIKKNPNKTDKFYIKQMTKRLAGKNDSSIVEQFFLFQEDGNKDGMVMQIAELGESEGKYIQI